MQGTVLWAGVRACGQAQRTVPLCFSERLPLFHRVFGAFDIFDEIPAGSPRIFLESWPDFVYNQYDTRKRRAIKVRLEKRAEERAAVSVKSDFEFSPVALDDYGWIYPYTSAFGEGSCQHSPVSMYSLQEKYGDSVCEKDGFLYTLRSRLCNETYRVYLAPLGGGDLEKAFSLILSDAAAYGKKVKFLTLTEKTAAALDAFFPGRFTLTEDRDLAEYMYKADVMAAFSGGELRKRRTQVHAFWSKYGPRAAVSLLCPRDFEDVMAFEMKWLSENAETHDREALERDARMIEMQLEHFDALRLSGMALRVDGEIAGFCYGTKLSDQYFDAIVEKADRNIPHSYKVVRQESARLCAAGCDYINMEEDVGVPGLRALKLDYKPDYLLRKFIAAER